MTDKIQSKSLIRKMFICLLALFISISAVYLLSPTLQVHASDVVNGGQTTGTAYTDGHYPGGATERKTGIFMYFASKSDGTPETAGLLIVRNADGLDCDDKSGLASKSKFGTLSVQHKMCLTDLPAPVLTEGNKWETNGYEVKG